MFYFLLSILAKYPVSTLKISVPGTGRNTLGWILTFCNCLAGQHNVSPKIVLTGKDAEHTVPGGQKCKCKWRRLDRQRWGDPSAHIFSVLSLSAPLLFGAAVWRQIVLSVQAGRSQVLCILIPFLQHLCWLKVRAVLWSPAEVIEDASWRTPALNILIL